MLNRRLAALIGCDYLADRTTHHQLTMIQPDRFIA
jgi:hypothetical protein